MANNVEKLSKRSVRVISFLSGLGILALGGLAGIVFMPTVDALFANAEVVIALLLAAGVVGFIWLLGRPVANILERR